MTALARLSALAVVAAVVVLAWLSWFPAAPPAVLPTMGTSTTGTPMMGTSTVGASATAAPAVAGGQLGAAPAHRIIAANMPDPSLLHVADTYYLYATQGATGNVQTATSPDLTTWTAGPDALPVLGSWARSGRTWAPEVLSVPTGYVLFYTALDRVSGLQCIGRATAAGPAGPFVDDSATPLVCQRTQGGSIDPDPVAIDGRITLYWKNDGNCCDLPVQLWGQRLDSNADRLVGAPVPLLRPTAPWQGRLVEAPEMVAHAGRYYLFYAANAFGTAGYAEGVATCATPLGPCADGPGPVLTSVPGAVGPGHAFVLDVGDRTVMVFHAWSAGPPGAVRPVRSVRSVWLTSVGWVDGAPVVAWPPGPATAVEALAPPR